MRKFFIYLKIIIICGPVIIFDYFRNIKYARHPEKYPFDKRYAMARKEIMFVLKRFHIDPQIENQEVLLKAKKPQLIISNHYSVLDPLMYIVCSERPITFLSKKENLKTPFAGQILKMLQTFTINRKNVLSQVKTLQKIGEFLKDESKPSVVIFIEGTRNKQPAGDLLPFHPGTLKIAYKANCEIVPVSMYGTFRVLKMKSYLKKYPFFWTINQPIIPDEYKDVGTIDLAEKIRKLLGEQVEEFRQKDREYIYAQKLTVRRKALETIVDLGKNS